MGCLNNYEITGKNHYRPEKIPHFCRTPIYMSEKQSNILTKQLVFVLSIVLCATPYIGPPIALLLGIIIAQTTGHPWLHLNSKATKRLLQYSVVGLGFGMNWAEAMKAGQEGFVFTVCSIAGTFILGVILSRFLSVETKTSYLISSGTAICGGSAIAAVSPILKADDKQISVALGTVFILNSIALFIFPVLGHHLHLSSHQFGVWAAIAIHDTSSVVGAAAKYSDEALKIATTIKLERALWIIPLSVATSFIFKNRAQKVSIPWFILFFVLAMLLNTYIPVLKNISSWMVIIAKKGLTITLFLIGAGLSRSVLRSVGFRPLIEAVILWICISSISLWVIMSSVS
jgi:uncharacterized integral membrane protein (TIGR00698 family)